MLEGYGFNTGEKLEANIAAIGEMEPAVHRLAARAC